MRFLCRAFAVFLIWISFVAAWSVFASCYTNTPAPEQILQHRQGFLPFLHMLLSLPCSLVNEIVGVALFICPILLLPLSPTLLSFAEETEPGIAISLALIAFGLQPSVFSRPFFPFPVLGMLENIVSLSIPYQHQIIFLVPGIAGPVFFLPNLCGIRHARLRHFP